MNRISTFFILFISSHFLLAQISTQGLISHWPFNGNANDISVNNYHGVVYGATLASDRFGTENSSYSFSSNAYIEVLNFPASNFSNDFSIAAWVKFNNFQASYPHIIHGENNFLAFAGTGEGYNADVKHRIGFYTQYGPSPLDQQPNGQFGGSPLQVFPNDQELATGKFYHVVITKHSDSVTNYLDGIKYKKVYYQNLALVSGNKITFGRAFTNLNSTDYSLNGSIDDIRIYNKALVQQEVASLFTEGKCFEKISVTDTLRISSLLTYNDLPHTFGELKIYPNPAHTLLTISFDKPSSDYSLKITNNLGQVSYSTPLTSSLFQVNLSQFTSKGLYLIQIVDGQNRILDVRKLVLE